MPQQADSDFFERADAHIRLSNQQITGAAGRGKVSASMLYATARFNAWVSACGFGSAAEMAAGREETVDYFVAQYRQMLEEHLDEYIASFGRYMRPAPRE